MHANQLYVFSEILLDAVSLENVVLDVTELENGLETTRREYEASEADGEFPSAAEMLKTFLSGASEKMSKLRHDYKAAQVLSFICLLVFLQSVKAAVVYG
jgi:hypothetical protein